MTIHAPSIGCSIYALAYMSRRRQTDNNNNHIVNQILASLGFKEKFMLLPHVDILHSICVVPPVIKTHLTNQRFYSVLTDVKSSWCQHFPHHYDMVCQKCDPDNSRSQSRSEVRVRCTRVFLSTSCNTTAKCAVQAKKTLTHICENTNTYTFLCDLPSRQRTSTQPSWKNSG